MVTQDDLQQSPFIKASFISKLFFWWMNGFFGKGNKGALQITDLYQTLPNDKSKLLGDRMAELWEIEYQRCTNNPDKTKKPTRPSLRKVIIKQFGAYYMLVGLLAFVEECFTRIAQPICLGYLIRYFSTNDFTRTQGFLFAAGVVLGSAFYTFTHHPYFFGVQHVGMKIRIASCSLLYRKALKLTQSSLGKTTIGQMVNLLSNDVNRFDQATIFLHYLWIGPIQTSIVTYILWTFYGWTCLVGVAVLVFFVPFQGYMGKLFSGLRTQTAAKTDRRIRIMNEVVSGMRVIKMYTWEMPFSLLVGNAREEEIKMIKKTSRLRAINMSLFYTSSKLVIFLTLLTYVLTGNSLTAEKVFVTLSLYNNVRLIMTLFFPNGVSQLAEALVSISRIEDFLLMDERPNESIPEPVMTLSLNGADKPKSLELPDSTKNGVFVDHLSAKWTVEYEENTLTDISIKVSHDELIAIIGHVGSGKSSLIAAILHELPATKGDIQVIGNLAYASQEPWVFSGTVQQNILFGKPYEESWYNQVVEACALSRDLDLLPYGDSTLVGDRGNSLSGGQKARVTLAREFQEDFYKFYKQNYPDFLNRAVYADADIYLLDDPLSAVDAEVGRHLFEKCICGILAKKTRILVTHQLQFLKSVNHIILIKYGKIQSEGTYDQLIASGIDFAQLLQSDEDKNQKAAIPAQILNQHRNRTASEHSVNSITSFSPRRGSMSLAIGEGSITGNMYSYEEIVDDEDDDLKDMTDDSTEEKLLDTPKRKYSVQKVAEEVTSTGNVKWSLYWNYFRAGSNCFTMFLLIFSNVLTQLLFTGSDYWLNFWTEAEEKADKGMIPTRTEDDPLYYVYTDRYTQIYIYTAIIGGLFATSLVRTLVFFDICMGASQNLHKWMFSGVLRAPMKFFDSNPVGRLLNRLTKDIGLIDDMLPQTIFDVMEIFLNVLGILVIIGLVNPILLTPAAVLSVVFYLLRRFYLQTARSIKRLEGVGRSPVFSHLSTSLYGLTTIRAFKAESEFIKQFDDFQDMHTSSWYLFIASTRWFGIWLDWISVCFIAFVSFSFMFSSQGGAQVGLAVSSAMMLTGMFQWGVRQSAEVENQMVSVERVLEYTKLESEPPLQSPEGEAPPKDWPNKGEIKFEHVELRYGVDNRVLKDVNCVFHPSEKVGIVGRTGAGKSSLITVLFRLAEPTGAIIIDGINVLNIGLHELRSKVSIIPQDPVLFTGTLRKNLDPFSNYSDTEIWDVLEEVHLAEEVKGLPPGLDVEIAEGGSNFSVGQRQLVCLGRAILRKNKILVLDEATANVDPETDNLIQNTIRTKFLNCTVLTVAHRLHTVMDCDRILVLDAGCIMEFDEPYTLLQDKTSALYSLVEQTGSATADNLLRIAKEAATKRNLSVDIGIIQEEEVEP